MKAILALVVVLFFACYAEAKGTVTAVEVTDTRVRAIVVTAIPTLFPRILDVKAIAAEKSTGQGQIDAVEFLITDLNQTSLLFAYFHAQGDVPAPGSQGSFNGQASAFAMVLRCFAVFEFDDLNGVPGFQANTADNVTGLYDLSAPGVNWKAINWTKQSLQDATTGKPFEYHTVEIATTDNVFLLRFHVATVPVQIGTTVITPDSVKIDIELNWFGNPSNVPTAWSTGPSNAVAHPNAEVGVIAFTAAAGGAVNIHPGSGGASGAGSNITFAAGGVAGFFQWSDSADTVTASGAGAAVVRAVEYSDGQYVGQAVSGWVVKLFAFTFNTGATPRPTHVSWDPTMGGQIDYANGAGALVASVFLALFALFM